MPKIRSAAKRLRQTKKRTERNRAAKSSMKTFLKRAVSAIDSGDRDAAERELKLFIKKVDTVAGKGIIHKNTAARKKSRVACLFNKRFASA